MSFLKKQVFWSFEKSKRWGIVLTILCCLTITKYALGVDNFNIELIKEMNDVGFTVVLAIAALGISIFSTNVVSKSDSKDEYVLKYSVYMICLTSFLIFVRVVCISYEMLTISLLTLKSVFLLNAFIIISSPLCTMAFIAKIYKIK